MMKTQMTPTWNDLDNRRSWWLNIFARLKPGVTARQADAAMNVLYRQIQAEEVKAIQGWDQKARDRFVNKHLDILAGDKGQSSLRRDVSAPLKVLMCMVGLVLLIACANVASLLLGRATVRQREFAIRAAIGAGRGRLLRQFATESVLLSTCGAGVGLGMGSLGVHALLSISPGNIPRIGVGGASVGIDWRVLMFTLGISLLVGIVFGIVPALRAWGPSLSQSLNEGNQRLGSGSSQSTMRSLIVLSEVSLSVVLLIGAALLLHTFVALRSVNPGFDRHNVFLMEMSLHGSQFATTANVTRLVEDARQRAAESRNGARC